ncbi:MAG: hypothetical protein OEV44_12245 [Spirochaetota bacterium]|nr:hypothetical protein [Spirochaetota bacterium]
MKAQNIELKTTDYEKIFEDFSNKGKELFPEIISITESFNENKISIESYQQYISILNQPPVISTSNHVG